jgi:hypothetical protein
VPISFIQFDGWAPSAGYFGDGWNSVSNIIQSFNNWRPLRKFKTVGNAIAGIGPMYGGHVHLWATGVNTSSYLGDQATIFTGSKTKLGAVDQNTGAFTDLSRGGGYGVAAGASPAAWRGASVGNDVWMGNGFDVIQRRTANAGNFADGCVSTFTPKARFLTTVREHLVVGNLSNSGRFQDEVAWSDADDATNFDPPTLTSTSIAGSKRLPSIRGQITGLLGGQYLLVFKRHGIFYGAYAGSPAIFQFDVLSSTTGTAFPSSIIQNRYGAFFLGSDGFYVITGLAEPQKISPPGVDQFLLELKFGSLGFNSQALNAVQEDSQAIGFQFPAMPLVGWALRGDITATGNDVLILFNPATGTWSTGDLLFSNPLAGKATTMLSLPFGATIYDTVAAMSWDSSASRFCLYSKLSADALSPVLSLNYRPANFAGTYQQQLAGTGTRGDEMTATIVRGLLPVISGLTPFTADSGCIVTANAASTPAQIGVTTETRFPADRDAIAGWYPFMASGRFFQILLTLPSGDFNDFSGVWIDQGLLK